MRDGERDRGRQDRKDIFDICRGGLKGGDGRRSSLPDMPVCTHQSLNRCNQVRKACILCDKLTSGNKNRRTEEMEKERTAGGGAEEAIESGLNIGPDS